MKLRLDRSSPTPIHEQLRDQIHSALHVGELRPGDRLPSLREMSRRHSVNPKTVLRAYRALSEQGLIVVRPGSGAIVGGLTVGRPEEERAVALLQMARRHRTEAIAAGLSPEQHRALLQRLGADGVAAKSAGKARPRVVFLECNGELATIAAREIARRTGVLAFPLVLPADEQQDEAILRMADLWTTTDFHSREVRPRAARQQRPCLTLRLDPRFAKSILTAARRGTVVMVHPDPSIVPEFVKILADAGAPREVLERIRGVAAEDTRAVRRAISEADSVFISPLCSDAMRSMVPRGALLPVPRWMIAASSVDSLRAMVLALPIISREIGSSTGNKAK